MNAPDGRPTNAVFGCVRDLLYLREECRPTYLLAAFDRVEPTFRSSIDPAYKAQRPPPPSDLEIQVPMVQEFFAALGVPTLSALGFEADDVMATVAAQATPHGHEVFLCTADKDCRQLLSDRVKVLNLRKRIIFDAKALADDWGITPAQVTDFQALVGDSVDNVPGVPGVGPKTATKWLQQYGSLDGIIAHADEVTGPKIRQALKDAIVSGALARSRKLVTLDRKVPIACDWTAWAHRKPDVEKGVELCRKLGFRRFADQIRAWGGNKTTANLFEPPPANGDPDFAFGALAPADAPPEAAPLAWQAEYTLVDTPAQFAAFLALLRQQKRFAFDTETTGLDVLTADLVGLSFCWQAGQAYYLPIRTPEGDAKLDESATLAALAPVFADAAVQKVNQNIKFDLRVLAKLGIAVAGVAGDSMIAHYLLHAGERSHNLDDLAQRYLQHKNIAITDLIGKKGKKQITLAQVPTAKVCQYAAEDADVAWRLTERLEAELSQQQLRKLYDTLEVPLIPVLAELEQTGIRLDVAALQQLGQQMHGQLADLEKAIYALAGREFNIASLRQLREVLFDDLKLPAIKRTGITNEASTDQETLERLAELGHQLPQKLLEHRQLSKLTGTYVDVLPGLVQPTTGRVHTSFNQTVAATGRLSSSEPNLQNIPARTDQGKEIRQGFVPAPGWRLVTADYSQVELRLLAHFCGDANLRTAFAANQDIHAAVAGEIFQVPPSQANSQQRRIAKMVNFGVLYGISPVGLATRLNISKEKAGQFIDDYFARYPTVAAYQTNVLDKCHKNGYVETILGRRRQFDPGAIRPRSTYHHRNGAEREAINMEIQGSAADLMKLALLAVQRRLRHDQLQTRLLLTVHDELVLEAPPDEVAAVAQLVRAEMSGALPLQVPLVVDVAAGPNWLDVVEVP